MPVIESLSAERHDADFPRYDVSSWKLETAHPERDPTEDELKAITTRQRANMKWFFQSQREQFTVMEAAELLGVPPPEVMDRINSCVWREEGSAIDRVAIFAVASDHCTWSDVDVLSVIREMTTPERSIVPPERLHAIRAFFTEPKDEYTAQDLEAIFGSDLPEDVDSDRESVAAFLRGYVAPVIVGRALVGLGTPLELESRTIELPRWMWQSLDTEANETGHSVSETLSMELHAYLNDGLSENFAAAAEPLQPDYRDAIATK